MFFISKSEVMKKERSDSMMLWGWVIGFSTLLLLVGAIADRIAQKRSIEFSLEEGTKNASDAERIYVEHLLSDIKNNNNNQHL